MRFETYADTGGEFRWRLLSGSNKVAASGESFASKSNADRAADGFKSSAKTDDYEVWATGIYWYWHAKAGNGRVVATGGESFATRDSAQRSANNVRDNAGTATGP